MPAQLKEQLFQHLFPGDRDEHGAVLAASLAWDGDRARLLVRHVIIACARSLSTVPFSFVETSG
jgi:hypothetical protein